MKQRLRFMTALLMVMVLLSLSTMPPVQAQELDTVALDSYVADMMTLYDVPGAAIAIVQDGEVIYSNGFGVRNTETGEPNTAETQFAIGSVTKSFTALAIAQLVDAGVFDLDTPVIDYWPDFKLADETATQTVTLRHLLSHTSGLPPYTDDFWYNHRPTRQEIIENVATISLSAAPGELYQYNNQNFLLAGWLIEQVVGQTWEDYVREHIFMPLGMENANFDIHEMQQQPDYAWPHAMDILEGVQPIPFFDGLTAIGPAGSINATIQDMANYAIFQLGDGTFKEQRVVSETMLNEMHTPQVEGYGLGWVPDRYKGIETVWHNGSIDGFTANMMLVPSENLGAVALSNADEAALFVDAVLKGLVDRVLDLGTEPPIEEILNRAYGFDPEVYHERLEAARTYEADMAQLEALVGDYTWSGGEMRVDMRQDTLFWHIEYSEGIILDLQLVPFEENQFLVNARGFSQIVIRFETDENGSITIFQDDFAVAQRLAEGIESTIYADPQGRFSLTLPAGLIPQALNDDLAIIISTDPQGAFVVGVGVATQDDLSGNVQKLVVTLDPSFDLEPDETSQIVLNEQNWTEFTYPLPGGQVLVVRALQQGDALYVVMLQTDMGLLEAAQGMFDELTTNFLISAPTG